MADQAPVPCTRPSAKREPDPNTTHASSGSARARHPGRSLPRANLGFAFAESDVDLDGAVLDAHREGADREVGGQAQRLAGLEIEHRAVAGAGHGAVLLVPAPEADGAVVVRAAILDRVQLAAAVVDADAERADLDELHLAGRKLLDRRNVQVSQSRGPATRPAAACRGPRAARP